MQTSLQTLYVATDDALAKLSRRGENLWDARLMLEGSGVNCLALDPADENVVYAGSRGEGVWKSRDAGGRWANCDLPQPEVLSLAVSAADGAIYAGCEPSMIFRSRDGGQSWDELAAMRAVPSAARWSFPPRPWTSHVRAIAPSPHAANILLAGIEAGALLRSDDGGWSWEDHRPGAGRDTHALAWHPRAKNLVFQAAGDGAAFSQDGGKSWQDCSEGLKVAGQKFGYVWALALDPNDEDRWLVSASPGPQAAHNSPGAAAIFRRRESSWQQLSNGLPNPLQTLPYALLMAGEWLFAGLGDGRVFASQNGGDLWREQKIMGAHLPRILALAGV